jgi:hypothetical protein
MIRDRYEYILLAALAQVAFHSPAAGQKPGAPAAATDEAAEALPPNFRGRINYEGTHRGEVTRPGPPLRSLRTRDVVRSMSGGSTREYGGNYSLELTFEGDAVTGHYSGTGGMNSGTLSGTRDGDRCRLVDDRYGTVTEAICTRRRLYGDARVERGRDTTVIRVEAGATRLVDAVEEQRQQQLAQSRREQEAATSARQLEQLVTSANRGDREAMWALRDVQTREGGNYWIGRAATAGHPRAALLKGLEAEIALIDIRQRCRVRVLAGELPRNTQCTRALGTAERRAEALRWYRMAVQNSLNDADLRSRAQANLRRLEAE